MPLWIPDVSRPFEEQSRFAMDPGKYGYTKTTMAETSNGFWEDGPQGRFGSMYRGLCEVEQGDGKPRYKTEEATFQEEMSFMNWRNDNLNLYQVINFLEHEWYVPGEQLDTQPPLPFSYHNWLIDPNYKWEDMKQPQKDLKLPKELASKFIKQYKQNKLGSSV